MDEPKPISMSFDDLIDAYSPTPDPNEQNVGIDFENLHLLIRERMAQENPQASLEQLDKMAFEFIMSAYNDAHEKTR